MEKTIKIGKTSVKLNNNIGWLRAYRSQFGHDILPALMPIAASVLDVLGALIDDSGEVAVNIPALIKAADSEKMFDAVIHASGFEVIEIINITWALAKCADPNTPEPEEWEKQFDTFPLDIVVPAVGKMIIDGAVSSKNAKRLANLTKANEPTPTATR